MRYSTEPQYTIFVKSYEFLSFAKNIGKNIGKNISKDVSGKYGQKIIHNSTKTSGTDADKTSPKKK